VATEAPPPAAPCKNCGVVEAVRAVQVAGEGSGLGAVAGGVTGAVVGSQIGRGNGRTAMGVLGAVGGAYAGHAIEKNVRTQTSYRVSVRMEDDTLRTVYSSAPPAFAVGDKVRVINGALAARG
jgi:outer membrane lipoprotein SlyB